MGLVDELPTREQFDDILAGIVGEGAAGTGVAGVLTLLQGLDPPALSASAAVSVDGGFSAGIQVGASGDVKAPLAELERAVAALPDDPAALVAPLAGRLSALQGATGGDLVDPIKAALDGLRGLDSFSPPDTGTLVAGATQGIEALKGELVGGAFAELREWSAVIERIAAELEPLFAGGEGTLEDRLIAWLTAKLDELVVTLVPHDLNLAPLAVDPLRAALPAERLTAFATLRADLIAQLQAAAGELAAGNTTNLTALQAAQDAFVALTAELGELLGGLTDLLESARLGPDALLQLQREVLEGLRDADVVDLGNVRQRFAAAIMALEEKVRAIDLGGPLRDVGELFDRLDAHIDQLQLRGLGERLQALTDRIQSALGGLDASIFEIVATLRQLFGRLKSTLDGVASTLGSFAPDGSFRFTAQDDIEHALQSVRDAIDGAVRPVLEQLRTTVGGVLEQVQERLQAIEDQIEGAKQQLSSALQGVSDRLDQVDATAQLEGMRDELQRMLDELGHVDFDVVAEPVIGELDEMRELLAGIDVSALGEVSIGALKVSVSVVVEVDFSTSITSVLMEELDKLLELPKDALAQLEAKVEGAIAAFAALDPAVILAPLHDVFAPVEELLGKLELDALLEPINARFEAATGELDKLDPAVLLKPVVDVHAQLEQAIAGLTPGALVAPLHELLADVKAKLSDLGLEALEDSMRDGIGEARASLEKLSPAALLDPLVELFDKILGALDGLDPAVLLEPLTGLFDRLTDPLARLTAEHASAVALAFAPLRAIVAALDPRAGLGLVREAASAAQAAVRALDAARLIADLRGPYEALHASAQATGPGGSSLSVQVDVLNPLRDPALAQATVDLQAVDARLAALAALEPPAELDALYATVKDKLSGVVPSWAKPELTPDEVRRAFQDANPLALREEIRGLWKALVERLTALSPKLVKERLQESYDRLLAAVLGLDPAVLLAPLHVTLDGLAAKLDAIDPNIVLAELTAAGDDVVAVVHALDPQPVIDALEGIAGDVKALIGELNPAAMLSELQEPLDATKAIVSEFDPAALAEPLQELFKRIQGILLSVDVGVLLTPLDDKLEELRSDLSDVLDRVEAAFNAMLAAIPVGR
jgi:hypothetical protein